MYDSNNTRFAGVSLFTEGEVASFNRVIKNMSKQFEALGESIKKFSERYEEFWTPEPSNKDEKEKYVEIRVLGEEDKYSCVDEIMLYTEKYFGNDRIFVEETVQNTEDTSTNREKRRHTDSKWHDTRYKRKQYDKRYF